ncbi:hypothetical protein [Hymenobacter sp. YC55]|uniref:hypothetical protein n=1 Tax=Hymenobacter sp. YC55 TaxID=3034019 RepID=UPI0023F63B19|nr:hypothetical protein [Hymenobacter sp. YC55]MDF7809900.1 hypothetical protein [Hymenobacter sp. YC55]
MARTQQEIFDAIQASRAADPVLARLNSTSATALHRLWAFITAFALHLHEVIFDRHKADVETALARAKPGTAAWYADQALLFQAGDTLVADDDGIHYAAGSTGAKIITRAAAIENELTGKLFIKVAKNGPVAGTLAALSNAELTQVRGYFDRKGFAGVRKEIVSRAADKLRVEAKIYYDPLIDVPALQLQVQASLRSYLAALEFNGLIYLAKIQDYLQAVPGVKDVQMVAVTARAGAGAPTLISRVYETQAGYIVEDDAAGSTLVDTLTYLPYGSAIN